MRKANPETHQACRSLLQKAVRRGNILLVRKIAHHLYEAGDIDWLKMRAAVITFEECWPLGSDLPRLTDLRNITDMLVRVTKSVKAKNAAGLGVLAYEFSEGDISVLVGNPKDQYIEQVVEAIRNPQNFWNWATENCSQDNQRSLILSSMKAYRRGGWPWDRALILAAAYLGVTDGVPDNMPTEQSIVELPYWVGLDKHTPQGKKALQEAAKSIGISVRQLSWISFYLESARVNGSIESYWWSRELQWRLSKVGISQDMAHSIWDKARPIVIRLLKEETETLQTHLVSLTNDKVVEEISDGSLTEQFRLPGF